MCYHTPAEVIAPVQLCQFTAHMTSASYTNYKLKIIKRFAWGCKVVQKEIPTVTVQGLYSQLTGKLYVIRQRLLFRLI